MAVTKEKASNSWLHQRNFLFWRSLTKKNGVKWSAVPLGCIFSIEAKAQMSYERKWRGGKRPTVAAAAPMCLICRSFSTSWKKAKRLRRLRLRPSGSIYSRVFLCASVACSVIGDAISNKSRCCRRHCRTAAAPHRHYFPTPWGIHTQK